LHPAPHCRQGRLSVARPYSRLVPSHAIELTSVFLDRNVTAILAHRPKGTASRRQTQKLAAIIHLCGAGPAKAFVLRGFHLLAGEHCGDQEVATYLAHINAMTREFLRIEAARGRARDFRMILREQGCATFVPLRG
jgi:hypothetical protein